MPPKIHTIISQEDDTNNTPNIIPILANLLQTSQNVEVAYLSNPSTIQIEKLPSEGAHFCGYRNIQMLWLGLHASNEKLLSERKPSIPEIQEMIEAAWDAGINSHGRAQTGGVKGTRKHIGTSEVCPIPSFRLLTYIDDDRNLMKKYIGRSDSSPPFHTLHRHILPRKKSLVPTARLRGSVLFPTIIPFLLRESKTNDSTTDFPATSKTFNNHHRFRAFGLWKATTARF
jgi:hypothetical protein